MRWRSGDYLDNQLVVHWGKVPLLPDGLLGPDVPGFQQGSLLELVVSVNHLDTSPASGMVMGSHMSHHGKLGQVSTCQGSSVLLQSVAQCSPCLANVHLQAVTTWDLVDHSCPLV